VKRGQVILVLIGVALVLFWGGVVFGLHATGVIR
jgi:hypothetical protein